ncbi:aminoacyl-tRNA hydrolase [Candidatus Dojkabacteria bacterium]|nr:aminoacyl-tRNA hydrolase [Candidatus Dojkabacteria bacterium]
MDYKDFQPKLIVGLGNPGKEYSDTFHNAGFMLIDYLRQKIGKTSEVINKKEYEMTILQEKGLKLLKPLNYMNNSGPVIAQFLKFNELEPEEILIAFDDLDLEFGEYKIQQGKFPKSHNGINSIHESTGKADYWYLRIGIETRDEKRKQQQKGEDYVLSRMTPNQQKTLQSLFDKISADIFSGL